MKHLLQWVALGLGALLVAPLPAQAAVTTSASPAAPIVVGTALSDQATLTLATPTVTPGTVTFQLFGPDSADCSTEIVAAGSTVAGTLETATTVSATSLPFTPTEPGVYRWIATYDGDGGANPPEAGLCNDAGETQTVQAQPAIATAATDVVLGQGAVSDVATVSGLHNPTAGGSVTFDVYGPGDTTCQNPLAAADSVALDPLTGTATATGFAPAQAGTYRWVASYGGDVNNAPVGGACNDAGETSTVAPAQPTITTVASPGITLGAGTLGDQATVSGVVSPAGPQTVTFDLYGPDDLTCAASAVFTDTATVNAGTAQSAAFTPVTAGTYRWRATYDGDANNDPVTGGCNDPTETRDVAKATPVITSRASGAIALGAGALTDQATFAGVVGAAPSGTATFQLFGPDDSLCAGRTVFSDTRGLTAAGQNATATSAPYLPTAAGVYRWRVVFTGDANFVSAATPCNDAGESAAVGPPVPPPATPPAPPRRAPTAAAAAGRPSCNARFATIVGTGQGRLTGTPGNDIIVGTSAAETIDGGGGDDTICAGGGADNVDGGPDQDVIFGGAGDDRLRGGAGNDRVFGEDGADLVLGNGGDDDLHGGRGRDRLAGGDGFDSVDGEAGDDLLDEQKLGGAGRDRLLGGSGADRIRTRGGSADVVDCGSGRDTATLDRTDRQKRCENLRP